MEHKVITTRDFYIEKKAVLGELHAAAHLPRSSFNKVARDLRYGERLSPESVAALRRYIVSYPELETQYLVPGSESALPLIELKQRYGDMLFPNALYIEEDAELAELMNTTYKMMTALYYLSVNYQVHKKTADDGELWFFPKNCCDIATEAMFRSLLYSGIPSVMIAIYNENDHAFPFIPLVHKNLGRGFLICDPTSDQFSGQQPNVLKLIWGKPLRYKYTRYGYPAKQPDELLYFNNSASAETFVHVVDPLCIGKLLTTLFKNE